KVRAWSSETKTGDLGDCDDLPEDSMLIPTITSTNDNCLGKECPSYTDCFVLKARKRAMDSDIVVVNHHLFLADLAIKETGFGELIPEADVFIFDEAHQLPDIASEYFGQSVSSRQIHDLAKDIEIAYRTEAKDMRQLQKVGDKLMQSAMDMRIVLGEPGFRGNWREALQSGSIKRELLRL
ncbi:ATP-dependent helicase, partial [Vibrio parahaemolyticus]|nr:ATP-dependent helicase [Vibrio parahaemolyticus]